MSDKTIKSGDQVYFLLSYDLKFLGVYHRLQKDIAFAERYKRMNYADVYEGVFEFGVFPNLDDLKLVKLNG